LVWAVFDILIGQIVARIDKLDHLF